MTKRIKNLQTYPTIEHRESSSNIVTLNKLKTIPTIPTQSFQSPWTADLSTILPDLLFTHTALLYVEQDVCTPAFLPFRKGRASSSFVPFPEHPSFHGPGGLPVPTAIFPLSPSPRGYCWPSLSLSPRRYRPSAGGWSWADSKPCLWPESRAEDAASQHAADDSSPGPFHSTVEWMERGGGGDERWRIAVGRE